jgi:hypothetical protein
VPAIQDLFGEQMNANKLADYLDNNVEAMLMSEQPYLDQAATMLRQQQAEIETMKNPIMQAISQAFDPVKELTDEEIQELALCDEFWISEDCTIFDWHKFARAILRKAQEK